MKKVLLKGPLLTASGYGYQARFALRSLQAYPELFDLYIEATNWGQCSWLSEDNQERREIDNLLRKTLMYKQQGGQVDVSVQVLTPPEFQKLAPINIGYTAGIETDKIAREWINPSQGMDHIILTSEHAKSGFDNTTYDATDQFGNQVKAKVSTPMTVVNYPFEEVVAEPIDLDLKYDFNFLVVAQWSPRKNLENTIKHFVEEMSDKEVGLIVKTSTMNNCVGDRNHTLGRIKSLISEYSNRKCQIKLLHGDLSPGEMVGLYTHPKVKALISLTHGEGYCGLDYTPIITENGLKRLDSVKVGEKVLTHKGRFMPITAELSRYYEGEMLKISTFGGQDKEPIILTPNHNVYVFNGDKFIWKRSDELNEGDVLCIPKFKQESISSIKLFDFIEDENIILENDKLNFVHSNGLGKILNNHLDLDANLGKLIGYYLAEGSYGNSTIQFSLHKDERDTIAKEIIDLFASVFDIHEFNLKDEEDTKRLNLKFNSKIVGKFLKGFCGNDAKTKFINNLVFKAPKEFKLNLISALILGDGYINEVNKNSSIELSLVNESIIRSARLLLLESQILSNFSFCNRKGIIKNKWEYDSNIETLKITQVKYFNKLLKVIKNNHKFVNVNLHDEKNISKGKVRVWNDEKFSYFEIKKINKYFHQGNVFNISVEEDESYCTENFMVHNCLPIFEAAGYGLPIITPVWGGVCDFVEIPQMVSKNKKKSIKNVTMVSSVEFDIANIQPEAVWNGMIIPESKWCFPKEWRYKVRLREMLKEYPKALSRAKKLQKHIQTKFVDKDKFKDFAEVVNGGPIIDNSIEVSLDQIPKISVITSVYNGDEFIESFMENITNQTIFEDKVELVLVNANSPGNEEPVIQKYLDKYPNNIKYVKLDEDPGIYGTWNKAIEVSTGEFITNANLDDRKAINSLEEHAKSLVANPTVSLVYADSYVTNRPDETFDNNSSNGQTWPVLDFSKESLMRTNSPHNNPMWRASLHRKHGMFDSSFRSAGDWEFFLRCAFGGEIFKKIHKTLGLYYFNPKGISTNPENNSWKRKEERAIFMKYNAMMQEEIINKMNKPHASKVIQDKGIIL